MSEPIKVGDLVVQVRACCENEANRTQTCGIPFIVTAITANIGGCWKCRFGGKSLLYASGAPKVRLIYVGWLKRIPPLSELEGEKRDAEISA